MGNHIDVLTGKWTATDAGIGAGVDSYYEYLVKGAALLQRPELMQMFLASRESLEQYMNHDDWYFWVSMKSGGVNQTKLDDEEQEKVTILNSSTVMSMEYDNLELEVTTTSSVQQDPDMSDVIEDENKVIENTASLQKDVYIKRQSKDETIIEITTAEDDMESLPGSKTKINLGSSVLGALNDILKQYLSSGIQTSKTYDAVEFRQRLLKDAAAYAVPRSWMSDHSVMSCRAQTFTERFSIQGEFFETHP